MPVDLTQLTPEFQAKVQTLLQQSTNLHPSLRSFYVKTGFSPYPMQKKGVFTCVGNLKFQ